MASVCSIWTCAVIGALGASCPGARADVVVSCEIRLDTETRHLVGVDEGIFDPDIQYLSPNRIKTLTMFLIDGPESERFLNGYIVDEALSKVPRHAEALEVDALELEWQELVVETEDNLIDVPALIQWDDQEQVPPSVPEHLELAPVESTRFLGTTTMLGIGLAG